MQFLCAIQMFWVDPGSQILLKYKGLTILLMAVRHEKESFNIRAAYCRPVDRIHARGWLSRCEIEYGPPLNMDPGVHIP